MGVTPSKALYNAAREGNVSSAAAAHQQGGQVNALDEDARETPLIVASRHGHVGVIAWLLSVGAQDLQSDRGLFALMEAAKNNQLEVLGLLLDKGVDFDLRTPDGMRAIDIAGARGHILAVRLIEARTAPFAWSMAVEETQWLTGAHTWPTKWVAVTRPRPWDAPRHARSDVALYVYANEAATVEERILTRPRISTSRPAPNQPGLIDVRIEATATRKNRTSQPDAVPVPVTVRVENEIFEWLLDVLSDDFGAGRGPAFTFDGERPISVRMPMRAVARLSKFKTDQLSLLQRTRNMSGPVQFDPAAMPAGVSCRSVHAPTPAPAARQEPYGGGAMAYGGGGGMPPAYHAQQGTPHYVGAGGTYAPGVAGAYPAAYVPGGPGGYPAAAAYYTPGVAPGVGGGGAYAAYPTFAGGGAGYATGGFASAAPYPAQYNNNGVFGGPGSVPVRQAPPAQYAQHAQHAPPPGGPAPLPARTPSPAPARADAPVPAYRAQGLLAKLIELQKADELLPPDAPEPPQSFVCVITSEIMLDPVVTADGSTYSREGITQWLSQAKDGKPQRSPLTGEELVDTHLIPNTALRSQIIEWVENERKNGEKREAARRPAETPAAQDSGADASGGVESAAQDPTPSIPTPSAP